MDGKEITDMAARLEALRVQRGVGRLPPKPKQPESSTKLTYRCPSTVSMEEVEAKQERYRRQELWDAAKIPRRHREHLQREPVWAEGVAEQAWDVVTNTRGTLALIGPRGTGKTQLAVWLAWYWVHNIGGSAWYTRADEAFETMRREFDGDTAQGTAMRKLCRSGLLIVDEMQDRKHDSQYERQQMNRLLDKRYGELYPTILIGNERPEEFAENVGPSIVSRIQEGGAVIVMDGPSFRKAEA